MSESSSGTLILNAPILNAQTVEGAEASQNQVSGQQALVSSVQAKSTSKASSLEHRRVLSRAPGSDLCIEYGQAGTPLSAFQRGHRQSEEPRTQITRLLSSARAEAIFSTDDWGVSELITTERPAREGEQISVRVNGINPILLDHIGLGEMRFEDIHVYAGMTLEGDLVIVPRSDTQRMEFGPDGASILVEFRLPIQQAYFYKKDRDSEGEERTIYGTIVGVTIPTERGVHSFPVWVDFDAVTADQLSYRQAALEASQALNFMLRRNRKAN